MRKKFLLLCTATTLILCCGCSNNNGTTASTDIVSEEATVSSTENTSEEPTEETTEEATEAAIPEYKKDDIITNDYMELNVDKIATGTDNHPMVVYADKGDDEQLFYIRGQVKNLCGTPKSIWNSSVVVCFDDKYYFYYCICPVRDGEYLFDDVNPLSVVDFYVPIAVSNEILNSFQTVTVTIGTNDDWESIDCVYGDDVDRFNKCKNYFKFTFNRDDVIFE